jgi:hypothetical protein
VISRKATSGTVTPMTAASTTSLGESTARYTRAIARAAISTPAPTLAACRWRPCGTSA